MNFIKHSFKRHLCVNNICCDDSEDKSVSVLRCKECGREIGFVYLNNGLKTFVHNKFKKYKLRIEKWAYENTYKQNYLDNSIEKEWEEVLHNLKQWHEDSIFSSDYQEMDKEYDEDYDGNGFYGGLEEDEIELEDATV